MYKNPNLIRLVNNAALVVKFSLDYTEDGQNKTIGTGDMTVGQERNERFSASVTSVKVTPLYSTGLSWEKLPAVSVTEFPTTLTFTGSLFKPDVSINDFIPNYTSSGAQGKSASPETQDLLLKYAKDGSLKNELSNQTMLELQGKLKANSTDEVPVMLLQASNRPDPMQLQNLLGMDLVRKIKDELNT